ncbi:hypothetical protein C8J56DRAFT_895710 [Mycena floridula]|nr:hypothetical protein C8J56DRAFT_895710 [Mycena floridula]
MGDAQGLQQHKITKEHSCAVREEDLRCELIIEAKGQSSYLSGSRIMTQRIGVTIQYQLAVILSRGKLRPDSHVAYMETQEMESPQLESDSEVGLGSIIATLSLGSPTIMHFRLRAKYEKDGALNATFNSAPTCQLLRLVTTDI